jgi:hypothetical protein
VNCPNCEKPVRMEPRDLRALDLSDGRRGWYLVCKTCTCILTEGIHFKLLILEIEAQS